MSTSEKDHLRIEVEKMHATSTALLESLRRTEPNSELISSSRIGLASDLQKQAERLKFWLGE